MLSYIPWDCRQSPATSVVVSDTFDTLSIPRPPPMPPLSSLSPRARLPPPTLPFSLSITWDFKHTVTSAVGDILSGTLFLLLPPPTPPLLLSSPRAHLYLPMPPWWLQILQARHCDATTSVIVPKSLPPMLLFLIPRTRRLFIVLCKRLRCL